MSIRTKTFLIIIASTACTCILLELVVRYGVLNAFRKLEDQVTQKHIERVQHILAHEVDRLSQTTCDWAYWDESYQYAEDHNQAYEKRNLNSLSLSGIGVDVVVIAGTSGEVLFAGRNDREAGRVVSLSEFTSAANEPHPGLLSLLTAGEGSSGYCVISGTPTFVVSRPILTSSHEGPVKGTLIMGRSIDREFMNDLTDLLQIPVQLTRIEGEQLPKDTKRLIAHLNEVPGSTQIQTLDTEVSKGYALLNDLAGNSLLLLEVTTYREVYAFAKGAARMVVGSTIPIGLLCCLILFLLMERVLVSRVSLLNSQVAGIGQGGNTSSRIQFSGTDELGRLAQSINGMLEGLEQAGENTHRSRELYWTLFEHSPLATLLVEPATGGIVEANPNALKYYGYSMEDIRKFGISDLLSGYPGDLEDLLASKNPSSIPLTFFAHSQLHSGMPRNVEAHVSMIEVESRLLALLAIHDVTERKVAQEEVSRLQRFYQLILDSIPADLTVSDLSGHILYINPAAVADASLRRWLIGKTDEDYCSQLSLDPSIARKREEYREVCVTKRCMVLFEEEIESVEGHKRYYLRFFSPMIEADGRITKVIGYGFDMTERKKAEDALRHSEERYRLLFEGSHDAIAVYGLDMRAVLFNKHYENLIGYNSDEYATIDPLLPVHPEDREMLIRNNKDRIAGLPVVRSYEIRVIHKNGEIRHVEATFDPVLRGEEIVGIQGLFRDITDRRRTEENLREHEDRYRLLFDHSNDGIALLGRDLTPLLINGRLSEMLGYNRNDLLSMNIGQVVHPDDIERVQTSHIRRLRGEAVPRTYELRLVRKDGAVLEVEGSFDSIYRGSEIIGIQAIIRDATERKRIQESLLERQKEESIITLAGGIAHDFNNILVGIMGSAALLQEDLANQPGSENLVNNILTSSGRMAELTNQLLAYARGGKHRPEPSDANAIINDTLRMLHGSLSPDIRLVCDLDADLWSVHADRTQITQVLLNILVNACESMEDGGTLLVRSRNTHRAQSWYGAWPEPLPPGDFVHIMISDTGSGMSEETRKRLFEPFYTTKFMGRGLGLAAAMGIIRNHEGSLSVESEPGAGSTFHVHLPRGRVEIPKTESETHSISVKSGTVLVVDDEETVRDVASRMLKRLGFSVVEAANGQTAIEFYQIHQAEVSLVLLDMQMPDMGGAEVYSRLHAINPGVRVLISSGYEETTVTDGITRSDCLAGFVKKPYTIKGLEAAIDKALHHGQEGWNERETTEMGVDT